MVLVHGEPLLVGQAHPSLLKLTLGEIPTPPLQRCNNQRSPAFSIPLMYGVRRPPWPRPQLLLRTCSVHHSVLPHRHRRRMMPLEIFGVGSSSDVHFRLSFRDCWAYLGSLSPCISLSLGCRNPSFRRDVLDIHNYNTLIFSLNVLLGYPKVLLNEFPSDRMECVFLGFEDFPGHLPIHLPDASE